jgi:aerobic-type carbon monoxide dehydrogenase small subunit (CoxS/CutS family)
MANISLKINNKNYTFNGDPSTPLLWVIRDYIGLKGTKYGCGIGLCGSCTILIDGYAIRSCSMQVSSAENQPITTIEGLASNEDLHPVQKAWIEEDVPQCGYCQAGQIMTAVGLLNQNPNPSEAEIENAMNGNVCRCGTYQRIKKGVLRASGQTG